MKKYNIFVTVSILLATHAPISWTSGTTKANPKKPVWVNIKTTDGQSFYIDTDELKDLDGLNEKYEKDKTQPIEADITYNQWNTYVQPFVHILPRQVTWEEKVAAAKQFITDNFTTPAQLNNLIEVATEINMAIPLGVAHQIQGTKESSQSNILSPLFVQKSTLHTSDAAPDIRAVNISNNGAIVITERDGTMLLWRSSDEQHPLTISPSTQEPINWDYQAIPPVALSPDGEYLALASSSRISIWQLSKAAITHIIPVNDTADDILEGIAYLTANIFAVITTKSVQLWNMQAMQSPVRKFKTSGYYPEAVAANANASLIAIPDSKAGYIDIINTSKLESSSENPLVHQAFLPEDPRSIEHIQLQFSVDGTHLIGLTSSTEDNICRWYLWRALEKPGLTLQPDRFQQKMARDAHPLISPDGHYIIIPQKKTCTVWNTFTREVMHTLPISSPHIALNQCSIVAINQDSQLEVWDLSTGKSIQTIDMDEAKNINKILFNPDGTELVIVFNDGTIHRWQTAAYCPTQR